MPDDALTSRFEHRPRPDVDAVKVTSGNIYKVRNWCGGEWWTTDVSFVVEGGVPPIPIRVGDWVVYDRGSQTFSGMSDDAFQAEFRPLRRWGDEGL